MDSKRSNSNSNSKVNSIGLTSGCFDILHEGHIINLKQGKNICDTLMVCLSSDDQINRLKGVGRPINKRFDRILMLTHYTFIDYIVLYDEIDDTLEIELDTIINIVNPTVWFKGGDYNKQAIQEKHPSINSVI